MANEIDKTNLITTDTKLEGTVTFSGFTRFDGSISGNIVGQPGSEIVLGETGVVEGRVNGDVVIIDGFIRGEVEASSRIVLTETGRVIGKLRAPSIAIGFGAFFEGTCETITQ
ncbi:MAG TPA: polymer-forming cytoskeletal protein [Oligoflexia bacterium]|nr:polymer-forming cytoskeletal protein [Oligoflexia bacterium]